LTLNITCQMRKNTLPLMALGMNWKVRWAPEMVWTMWRQESSWPYWDLNSDLSVIQPVATHYVDWTILGQGQNVHMPKKMVAYQMKAPLQSFQSEHGSVLYSN
jgi:hypothetical protein